MMRIDLPGCCYGDADQWEVRSHESQHSRPRCAPGRYDWVIQRPQRAERRLLDEIDDEQLERHPVEPELLFDDELAVGRDRSVREPSDQVNQAMVGSGSAVESEPTSSWQAG